MTGRLRRPTRGRLVAVLCAVLMLLPVALGSSAERTEAAWADNAFGRGSYTAKTVPSPTVTTCGVGSTLGVINSVYVDFSPPAGYVSTDVKWSVGATTGSMAVGAPSSVTDRGGGVYRATFNQNILQDLLGVLLSALFGQSFYVAAHTGDADDGGWTSTPPKYSRVTMGLLGLNSSCTANVTP